MQCDPDLNDLQPVTFFSRPYQARLTSASVSDSFVLARLQFCHKSSWNVLMITSRANWPFHTQFGSATFVQGHLRSSNIACIFAYHFLQKRERTMLLVLLCSAGEDGSIGCTLAFFRYDLTLRSRDLRTPAAKTWPWLFGIKKCLSWSASTKETRWRLNYNSNILHSKFIHEKPHGHLRPLTWPQRPAVRLRS